MKSLIILGAVIGCAAASSTPISGATVERLKSSFSRLKDNKLSCPLFSFDVHVLIDGTAEAAEIGAYWNDELIPILIEQMNNSFPGSRVAVSWFRDKPFEPVGASNDTCFSLATDFTDSEDDLLAVAHARSFTGGTSPGGGDEQFNAQSQAILSAVQYSGLNWRESALARPYGDPSRTNVIKQVVILSYTKSHNPHDGLTTVPKLPLMIDNTYIASGNPDDLCRQQDYPNISKVILDSVNNNYVTFAALVPYNRSEIVSYWESIGSNVDPTDKGYFKVGVLVEKWELNLESLVKIFVDSAVETCGQMFDATSTAPPTSFPATTSNSTATISTVTKTGTAAHNCAGRGCCDGVELRAHGKVKHVDMEFEWAQRARRLLSAVAW